MKVKVKIKSLDITDNLKAIGQVSKQSSEDKSDNKSNQSTLHYMVSFHPIETQNVCGTILALAIDNGASIIKILKNDLENKSVSKDLFDFLSMHSREVFVLELDEHYSITGVSLIYE